MERKTKSLITASILVTILVLSVALIPLSIGDVDARKKKNGYRVNTITEICTDDNKKHEMYNRGTDDSTDSQGEHRNLLNHNPISKITVNYISSPGKIKKISFSYPFDPKVLLVPKLRVYSLLDDTVDSDYQRQSFNKDKHDYNFLFHLSTPGASCAT